jgi:hypothetical protein
MFRTTALLILAIGLIGCSKPAEAPVHSARVGNVAVAEAASTPVSNRAVIAQIGEYEDGFTIRAFISTDKTNGCQTYLFVRGEGITSQPVPGTCKE